VHHGAHTFYPFLIASSGRKLNVRFRGIGERSKGNMDPTIDVPVLFPDSLLTAGGYHAPPHPSSLRAGAKKVKGRSRSMLSESLPSPALVAQPPSLSPASLGSNAQKCTSRYRGVAIHRLTGRWEAHIWKSGKQIYLGSFASEEKAARIYDQAALKLKGTSAQLNFPIEEYSASIRRLEPMSVEDAILTFRRESSGFSRGSASYRGVSWREQTQRWEARIGRFLGRKYTYLGTFTKGEDAARAYDLAAIVSRGRQAITNFDISSYEAELKELENCTPEALPALQRKIAFGTVAASQQFTRGGRISSKRKLAVIKSDPSPGIGRDMDSRRASKRSCSEPANRLPGMRQVSSLPTGSHDHFRPQERPGESDWDLASRHFLQHQSGNLDDVAHDYESAGQSFARQFNMFEHIHGNKLKDPAPEEYATSGVPNADSDPHLANITKFAVGGGLDYIDGSVSLHQMLEDSSATTDMGARSSKPFIKKEAHDSGISNMGRLRGGMFEGDASSGIDPVLWSALEYPGLVGEQAVSDVRCSTSGMRSHTDSLGGGQWDVAPEVPAPTTPPMTPTTSPRFATPREDQVTVKTEMPALGSEPWDSLDKFWDVSFPHGCCSNTGV